MKSSWNESDVKKFKGDLLKLRVYTSQLLGKEEDLVLHGGGNTSVKIKQKNIFGEEEEILFVKGSGWDLATIEEKGFAPVKLSVLQQLAELKVLSDVEMVKYQRLAMTDPSAPNPSIEAILHGIIPSLFVDHTHADAVVTISNSPDGEKILKELYGKNMLILPYVMPGFVLAKQIQAMTKELDWDKTDGIILLNHGVFTFHDDPKISYERMINIVTIAEKYLEKHAPLKSDNQKKEKVDFLKIAQLRKMVSQVFKKPILASLDQSAPSVTFSNLKDLNKITGRGPLTPDHIIRTKRTPMVLGNDHKRDLKSYSVDYANYFSEFNFSGLTSLDTAPRWAVWPGYGAISFDTSMEKVKIIGDIAKHTMAAISRAERLGGWKTLSKKELFEMEYWSLEQEKLKKKGLGRPMQGKIALVTGAASGIGKACVDRLIVEGAVVAALDIKPSITTVFKQPEVLGIQCDVRNEEQLKTSIQKMISHFGGLDLLVSNSGIFPESLSIAEMGNEIWTKSLEINLTSHQQLLTLCEPFLEVGMDPAVVLMGSKNVHAPGPGAAAYSVAKAGLTQLGRIAAMEFGKKGIRVNIIHPNAVFDTGVWTEEVVEERAKQYGLTVEEYKSNNILKVEVSSQDVAAMVVVVLGPTFSKTTGAQVPIDGGNERII